LFEIGQISLQKDMYNFRKIKKKILFTTPTFCSLQSRSFRAFFMQPLRWASWKGAWRCAKSNQIQGMEQTEYLFYYIRGRPHINTGPSACFIISVAHLILIQHPISEQSF
jgi:hypothetical protein